jgi:ABC-type amino acid transport substrate-binding protein
MRKSVKLAAASALAAVALAGGSATAASANDKKDEPGINICDNGNDTPLVSAKDNGDVETDDIEVTGVSQQVTCQVGENNKANNINKGDVAGGDLDLLDVTEIIIGD